MVHLSVSQIFLVFVSEPAVSLQPAFTLSSLLSPPPQHLAGLQPAIILAHILYYTVPSDRVMIPALPSRFRLRLRLRAGSCS